jgi:hypothetical protein
MESKRAAAAAKAAERALGRQVVDDARRHRPTITCALSLTLMCRWRSVLELCLTSSPARPLRSSSALPGGERKMRSARAHPRGVGHCAVACSGSEPGWPTTDHTHFHCGTKRVRFFLGQNHVAIGRTAVYEWDFEGRRGGTYSLGLRI